MTRIVIYLPSLLLLLALALPSVGTLVDHHFAERQPGHRHLTSVSYHTHSAASRHFHPSTEEGQGSSAPVGDGQPVVLYNFDGGSAASPPVLNDDMAVRSITDYEPSSIFILPLRATASKAGRSPSPPDEPPQGIL